MTVLYWLVGSLNRLPTNHPTNYPSNCFLRPDDERRLIVGFNYAKLPRLILLNDSPSEYSSAIIRAVIKSNPPRPHIGLNAHLLSLSQSYRGAGISWYIYNLLLNLAQLEAERQQFRLTAFLHERRFQPATDLALCHSAFPTGRPIPRIIWEQFFQPVALRRAKIDLYHALAFVAPVMMPYPFVMTVYDLSFKRFPEAFKPLNRLYLNTFTAQSAKRARAIITISESTRQDVIGYFQVAPEKVQTIYCGVDKVYRPLPAANIEAFKAQQGLPERFILFVGTLEPRKNVAALIEAYAAWRRRVATQRAGQIPKLFIGGGKGWYYGQVFSLVQSLGLADEVIFPGYLPQADLPMWYNAATIFVYPSLFEGFGLPVLEAMACGTPVITSQASSLPEVTGKAGMLVDPTDIDSLSHMLERVFNDQTLRDTLRQKGLAQSANFSWNKTAAETLEVYRRTVAEL